MNSLKTKPCTNREGQQFQKYIHTQLRPCDGHSPGLPGFDSNPQRSQRIKRNNFLFFLQSGCLAQSPISSVKALKITSSNTINNNIS